MDKEIDKELNNSIFTAEVEEGVIERVLSGETTRISIDINEQNKDLILKMIDGNLVLNVKKLPDTFHGCNLYNKGVFPYVIKESLEFLVILDEENHLLTKIIGIETEPHTRFRFQGPGQPSVEDPKGDSCIWQVNFEVVPIPLVHRSYLMRWNPSISSFTEDDYEESLANMEHGMFRINWSIYEWQEARRGDFFYMLRTGDDKAGIVFSGQFLSDPYPGEDWAGTNKRRMYVDMVCYGVSKSSDTTRIPLEKLQSALPKIEWSKGHSGTLLTEVQAEKLSDLFEEG